MTQNAHRRIALSLLIVGAGSLGSAPSHADVSVDHLARRSQPAWIQACTGAMEEARARYAERDPRFRKKLAMTIDVGQEDNHDLGECGVHIADHVAFELPGVIDENKLPIYSGSVNVRSGEDAEASQPWSARSRGEGWDRHDAGRSAELSILDGKLPDGPAFAAAFKPALDRCLALAPAAPAPAPPPTDAQLAAHCRADAPAADAQACLAAERAAVELERSCLVEGASVGYVGRPGRTQPLLARIDALGPAALPLLLRLAGSTHPAARAVAAMGLGRLDADDARAALRRLAADHAPADTINGCIGSAAPVSSFVPGTARPPRSR